MDFPSVRESLKEQLKAKLIEEIGRRSEGNRWVNLGLGALGYAIAEPMIEAAVNVYVSPTGMKAMMAGTEPAMPDGLQGGGTPSTAQATPASSDADVQLS